MAIVRKLRRRITRRIPREYAIRYRLFRASLSPRAIRAERRADALLISYPKCGRTWLRVMISHAMGLHFGVDDVDYLGTDVLEGARATRFPRLRVSHDGSPHWKTPRQVVRSKRRYRGKKVLFLVRGPRDVVVSMYFERSRRERAYSKPLADFLHESKGSLATIIRYYNVWRHAREVPRGLCLVRYEDLHADTAKELRRIFDFLEVHDVSDAHIQEAVDFGSFGNMRSMEASDALGSGRLRARDKGDAESFKTRRGVVGGYGDYLDPEQIAWMEETILRDLDPWFGYSEAGRPEATATAEEGR
jgi:hypothetical protein